MFEIEKKMIAQMNLLLGYENVRTHDRENDRDFNLWEWEIFDEKQSEKR